MARYGACHTSIYGTYTPKHVLCHERLKEFMNCWSAALKKKNKKENNIWAAGCSVSHIWAAGCSVSHIWAAGCLWAYVVC
jgi:hypothetical protein